MPLAFRFQVDWAPDMSYRSDDDRQAKRRKLQELVSLGSIPQSSLVKILQALKAHNLLTPAGRDIAVERSTIVAAISQEFSERNTIYGASLKSALVTVSAGNQYMILGLVSIQ